MKIGETQIQINIQIGYIERTYAQEAATLKVKRYKICYSTVKAEYIIAYSRTVVRVLTRL